MLRELRVRATDTNIGAIWLWSRRTLPMVAVVALSLGTKGLANSPMRSGSAMNFEKPQYGVPPSAVISSVHASYGFDTGQASVAVTFRAPTSGRTAFQAQLATDHPRGTCESGPLDPQAALAYDPSSSSGTGVQGGTGGSGGTHQGYARLTLHSTSSAQVSADRRTIT